MTILLKVKKITNAFLLLKDEYEIENSVLDPEVLEVVTPSFIEDEESTGRYFSIAPSSI